MKPYKSDSVSKMDTYHIMLDLARRSDSTLYNKDGSQNVSALNRKHFWNGYNYGTKHDNLIPIKEGDYYCIWRAGVDFRREVSKREI